MYIRRKLYSNIDGERVPVEQTVLYSAKDDAKGAAIGAGVAAGTAGLGAAGLYGAKKVADKAVSKAVENRMAIETGKIAGDAVKADAKHEAAQAASNKVNKIINSAKGWLTNAEGKEAAKAYEKTIAGKSGAAKEEMIKKLARLNKAAGNTALKRQLGVGAAILGTGAAVGAGVAHLKGKKKKEEEKVYSVLMTEDELALFSEIQKEFADSYEDLNYGDLTRNIVDKNPFTIKKLRELKREHLSKEKGKGRGHSALRSIGTATSGAIGGAIGGSKAGYKGAAIGALSGAALGGATGYGVDRAARRLRNKIRKSGGGGIIDDVYAREADRLAMLDGEMSKADFKKKWYRNDQAK